MSRIGKRPIPILDKVQVTVAERDVSVKGPKGELSYTFPEGLALKREEKELLLVPEEGYENSVSAFWGLARTLISNMVMGVTEGFSKRLEFNGVGYKASVSGNTLQLNLGYSHPIHYQCPAGIQVKVQKNIIEFSGCDKSLVGFVAAQVRSFRPPEPYKGKGIKYENERIIRKAGKSGSGGKK